jgi:hypothetical protein
MNYNKRLDITKKLFLIREWKFNKWSREAVKRRHEHKQNMEVLQKKYDWSL